jgi:outer membrane phospholipase A
VHSVASEKTQLEQLASAAPATSALARGFAGRFMPNLPVYFIYGSGADQGAKFQLSFDYRLATLVTGGADNESVTTLRLGYTQRTLWDINSPSSPFYDTSYMPELVLNLDSPMPSDANQLFTWLGLRAGFQHESNGKDGANSRSLNTFYIRPRFVLGRLREWDLVLLPEIYTYIGGLGENEDLKDYRGYGKLRFYLGRSDGPSLMFTGWSGQHLDHVSYQLDLAIPARTRWLNIEAYYYLQYFNGYGESLLAYRAKSNALRVGVGLMR